MKKSLAAICALLFLCVVSVLPPVQAQSARAAMKSAGPSNYDPSQEITLTGTVSSVVSSPTREMINGSHLVLATVTGNLDISLGAFALRGPGPLCVAAGQQIEVTGVMKTMKKQPVFLARTVKAAGRVFVIRNEHGIQVSPQARERAGKSAQSGSSL